MSTVDRKSQKRLSPRASVAEGRSAAPTRKPRRTMFWLVALLVIGAAIVAIAPTIISVTPLKDAILRAATADVNGTVTVGGLSLGWLSPPVISDLAIDDADGKPLVRVPSAAGDKSLIGLLFSPKNLGTFKVSKPRVDLVLRDGGSNAEDVLANLLKPSDKPSEAVDVKVEIEEATIVIRDEASGQQWQLMDTSLALAIPRAASTPLEMELKGLVVEGTTQEPFSAKFSSQQVARSDGTTTAHGSLGVKATGFPLALAQTIVRRAAPGTQLAGRLQAELTGQWGLNAAGETQRTLTGQAAVEELRAGGPWLSGEVLRLAKLEVPCQVEWTGDVLKVHQLAIACDAGQIACRGTVPGASKLIEAERLSQIIDQARRATTEIGGQVDLAMLAQLLPQTLRVRNDTQITSGVVTMQLTSRPQEQAGAADELAWQGKIETSRLVAVHQGKQLAWDKPLQVNFAGREGAAGLTIDRLKCESDFLQLEGSGTPEAFRLQGNYDLSRLAAELGKFVNLDRVRLTGQGTTDIGWKRNADNSFEAGAQLGLSGFELALEGLPPWAENQLNITASAGGVMTAGGTPDQINSGKLTLISGGDQLAVTLRGPVSKPSFDSTWPLDVQAQGQLASWLRRALAGSTPQGWEITGQAQWSATATYSAAGLDIERTQVVVQPLRVHGNGLFIDEPSVRLVGAGKWLAKEERLELSEALLDTPALSAQARQVVMSLSGASAGDTRGALTFDGDVAKLQAWMRDPALPQEMQLTGHLRGQGNVSRTGQKTSATFEAVIENLLATPRGGKQWREPNVKLTAGAAYDHSADSVEVSRVELASDAVQLNAAGRIDQVTTRRDVKLAGQYNYDLDKLSRLLQGYIGSGVRAAGRESRSFSIAGPLATMAAPGQPVSSLAVAQQLTGRADFGWQWAQAYGFQVGQGVLQTELSGGILRVSPLDLAIGNGRLKFAPQVRLGPGPAELTMPAGPLLQQIEINREMCATGLMYVAPVLAGVAEAQGKFSVALDGARVPLSDPTQGDLAGKMTIHSVEIGPGPMVQELAVLLGREAPARLQQESEIPFRMVQGRVYHQNLQLIFPDLTIRTHGSVGLDQTLAIMAEMPVPPKWIGNNPLGTALKDQVIRLPIGGTLKRPQLDRVAMEQAAAQFIRGAAEGAIRNGIGQGLDRLFGPMMQPK